MNNSLRIFLILAIFTLTVSCGEKKPDNRILPVITQTTLKNLEKELTIKLFMSGDIPEPLSQMRLILENLFFEMYRCSNELFDYAIVDPDSNQTAMDEALHLNIPSIQVRQDEPSLDREMYAAIVIQYDDRSKIIECGLYTDSLPLIVYDLTIAMLKIMSPEKRRVGFLQGHGEAALRSDMTSLDRKLREDYIREKINLTTNPEMLVDLDVLCIISPESRLPESHLYAIDQFLMRGGRLLLATNMVNVNLNQLSADTIDLNINDWTENYGFVINGAIAIDSSARTAPFQVQTKRFLRQITMIHYPPFPDISRFKENFCPTYALREVALVFPSPVEETAAANDTTVQREGLMWTSDVAGIIPEPFELNPHKLKPVYDQSRITLSMLLTGRFRSAWENKPLPGDSENIMTLFQDSMHESANTAIIAIGDGNSIQDSYLSPGYHNLEMFSSFIDWLVFYREAGEITPLTDEQLAYLQDKNRPRLALKSLR